MLSPIKVVILSILVSNVLTMDSTTVGELPEDLREEFIKIVVDGILNIGNDCSEEANKGKVSLLLYTRAHPNTSIALDPTNPSQIDPSKKLVVVIHGWIANATTSGIAQLKDAYLTAYDSNVVVVDWSQIAWQLYSTAYCDLPGLGHFVGEFLCTISNQTGIQLEDVHVVGHSLGAQMSGFAGQSTKETCGQSIGRITGLDPAGVLFQDIRPSERLDPTDAIFVDVIHTDEGVIGYYGNCGDVDFHVNCGSFQPGTVDIANITDILSMPLNIVSGSHLRSIEVMVESIINTTTEFVGKSCFLCPKLCITDLFNVSYIIMGEHCPRNPPKNSYYVPTKGHWPYAEGCDPYKSKNCTQAIQ